MFSVLGSCVGWAGDLMGKYGGSSRPNLNAAKDQLRCEKAENVRIAPRLSRRCHAALSFVGWRRCALKASVQGNCGVGRCGVRRTERGKRDLEGPRCLDRAGTACRGLLLGDGRGREITAKTWNGGILCFRHEKDVLSDSRSRADWPGPLIDNSTPTRLIYDPSQPSRSFPLPVSFTLCPRTFRCSSHHPLRLLSSILVVPSASCRPSKA